jgi:hypothetical protein
MSGTGLSVHILKLDFDIIRYAAGDALRRYRGFVFVEVFLTNPVSATTHCRRTR